MEIKDYLHLYLGCEGELIEKNRGRIGRKKSIAVLTPLLLHDLDIMPDLFSFKPYLRPLSDMTKDEARHFAWLCIDSEHHLDDDCRISLNEIETDLQKYDGGLLLDHDCEIYIGVTVRCFDGAVIIRNDGSICVEDEDGKKQEPIDDIAHKVAWLLSKHFDLFSLIESRLALDKTKQ